MIKLFGINDKEFASNGDKIIIPSKAVIFEEDNGSFYLDLETSLEYIDDLTEGRILIAPTPKGEQAFRVSNVIKTRKKLTSKCRHVYYDSANLLIADSYVVDKTCNAALDHLNSATDTESPFTTISDITFTNSYRCVRTTLEEAIKVVIERWGGHLLRDNFTIAIRENIGTDNGVVIRYAKNLKEINCEELWTDVVTKLLPVGKDGILLNHFDKDIDKYVYSQQQYELPYTKTISFNQDNINSENYTNEEGVINQEAYEQALVEDLRSQAQNYVDNNSIPKVNYTLKANLEKLTGIGDKIEVIDERLGINILTNVISYTYDCILGKYKEIEFGNFKKTINGLVSNIQTIAKETAQEETMNIQIGINKELNEATDKIWRALGSSYVIYEGSRILVLDKLPKENATNVIMINNGGIAFSQTGINGTFNSAWTIDGTLNMQNINVINLVADLIKGGTLKLGSNQNMSGVLELYDEYNSLIGELNKNGLKMYGRDNSYVLLNNEVGLAGYDANGNKIYWVDKDEFHMKKSVVEEEITLCNRARFIPITIRENGVVVNDGIGLVSVASGGGN